LQEKTHAYAKKELYSYNPSLNFYNQINKSLHPLWIGKIAQNTQSEPHGLPDGVRWYAKGELCAIMGDFNIHKN